MSRGVSDVTSVCWPVKKSTSCPRELLYEKIVCIPNRSFTGDVYIKGLPDFFNSYIRLGIHEFKTSKCDIQSFVLPIKVFNAEIKT